MPASESPAATIDPVLAAAVENGAADAIVVIRHDDLTAAARDSAADARGDASAGTQSPDPETDLTVQRNAANRAYLRTARAGYAERKAGVNRSASGVSVTHDFGAFPVELVRLSSKDDLRKLAADPDVASVSSPRSYTDTGKDDLKLIKQPEVVKKGDDGEGTAVAVLDSGVDYTRSKSVFGKCPGAGCAVVDEHEFAPDDHKRDDGGHGTNVASLVLRVAPKTKIIAGDVFDGKGATDETVIQGIQYVADHAAEHNVKALNLSLGKATHETAECTGSPFTPIFQTLIDLGVQPVVSAGNDGTVDGKYVDGVGEPACVPGAFVVGAVYDGKFKNQAFEPCTDSRTVPDQVTCFSQGGALVDLLAPGSKESGGKGIEEMSGTSQAAPHVSGAIAALASGDPADSASTIAATLAATGHPVTDARTGVAYPRLDMAAARAALRHGAIITNGTVGLGVNQLADLNLAGQRADAEGGTTYGLRLLKPNFDYVSPGCACEGWGVADTRTGLTGYADEASGTDHLAAAKFTHGPDKALSVVTVDDKLQVTHEFHTVRKTKALFQVDVTVKNIGKDTLPDVVYRRLVDWDMEPTAFSEYVTLQRGTAEKIRFSSDNGFASADPLSAGGSVSFTGEAVRNGPADHGALVDIALGKLGKGKSAGFRLFYGAATDEASAFAALKAVKAEAYSLGQPGRRDDAVQGAPGTAILAFTGVGGKAIKF
ncbi:S8 family serine peptidase [Actinoplanes sp. NPDC049548]|uniref:S8 family serine peptidase n=1 Tax=Actinoplanes sp. NPDC049548 TaxID=3155152 RepID=UPI00342E0B01